MEYRIVLNNDIRELENEINRFMKDGWKPQGGLCWDGKFLYQAMVREKPTY